MISKFYLDKEKDIIVRLSKSKEDEITYTLETPNHNTGNLITNLAKICKLETIKNEKDMKIISTFDLRLILVTWSILQCNTFTCRNSIKKRMALQC